MSRHRDFHNYDHQKAIDDYGETYGHSLDDESPLSASMDKYIFNREKQSAFPFPVTSIEEERPDSDMSDSSLSPSPGSSLSAMDLTPDQQACLAKCKEDIYDVVGDQYPDDLLAKLIPMHDFSANSVIDYLLSSDQQGASSLSATDFKGSLPSSSGALPQRSKRERKRNQPADNIADTTLTPFNGQIPMETSQADEKPAAIFDSSIRSNNHQDTTVTEETNGALKPLKDSPKSRSNASTKSNQKKSALNFSQGKSTVSDKDLVLALTGITVDDASSGTATPSSPSPNCSGMTTPVSGEPMDEESMSPVSAAARKTMTAKSAREREKMLKLYQERSDSGKETINLVVIGHVDAGKSTLMGHLLYQLGEVNKKAMHKFETESKKRGKASFQYAWVLDETEQERERGVTMDIAQRTFETQTKIVNLLDAPGHKDFIPNMITGTAQADVAILVVNATRGEFEAGFESGGQTKEHALLARSLGVSQLAVAVNKLDTVNWSQDRFNDITSQLSSFLQRQASFKTRDVTYVPCSGLNGINLTESPSPECALSQWYTGGTLVQAIEKFKTPERAVTKSLRVSVTDVFKGTGMGFAVGGQVVSGAMQSGDKVMLMPIGELGTVKGISIDGLPHQSCFAGDNVVLTLSGIDITNCSVGSVLCDPTDPVRVADRLTAQIVIFNNLKMPITKGYPFVFHCNCLNEAAVVKKLLSHINKTTGDVVRKNPKCVTKNNSAEVEIEINRPVCVELYREFRGLGRFMMRYGGLTIAAGLIQKVYDQKRT